MRVADQIANFLKAKGVRWVFGLPGGASLPLMDGLRRCGVEFVLVRNESSAVFMAGTVARLTGVPGVAITTLGPGATNGYAGIADAWLERAPVLLFTADFPEEMKAGHSHQVLDLESIFRPVTKWTTSIEAETALETVEKAFALAQSGRPGPVHLRLVGAVADSEVISDQLPVTSEPQTSGLNGEKQLNVNSQQITVNEVLAVAKRPVIVVGLGLEPNRPYALLQRVAESLGAPVIDLPKGKGAVPASHPLFVGTIGLTHEDPAYEILEEADCVLAIGFDPVELVKPWQHSAPLIWINNWENADPKIDAVAELIGPLGPPLELLLDADCTPDPAWGAERVARFRDDLTAQPVVQPAAGLLSPQTVLDTLRAHLPAETAITTDVGSHKIATALAWPAERPNRYFVSNGLSTMGYGLPAAIAANLVLDRPTVAIHGDGGFQMVMGELGILTASGRPVITVILNDSALDLIRAKQLKRDEAPFGTEFANPDFAAIAHAYRLEHYLVADEASCAKAIQEAVSKKRPAIIEALIDPNCYPTAFK